MAKKYLQRKGAVKCKFAGLLLLIILVGTVCVPSPVRAAKGIGIAPGFQEVELQQGDTEAQFEVTVSNSTDTKVDFRLSTIDFGALDESGGVAFLGRSGQETYNYTLSKWLQLDKTELSVGPGTTAVVKATIKNDDSLSPGGHYGAVLVTTKDVDQTQNDSVAMLPGASTLVLLKKYGGEKYNLHIDSIKANKSLINLPKSVNIRFQNQGNIHVVPRGTIELTGPLGVKHARGVINEASSFVLPDTFRQIDVPLTYNEQPWLPGRYTLRTTWRYDGTDQTQTHELHYWYLGRLGIGILIIISLAFVLYLYILYRRRPTTRN